MSDLNVSKYDNVQSEHYWETNEGVSLVITDILSVINLNGPAIFCPFCVTSLLDVDSVEKHLKSSHYLFLNELLCKPVALVICPFCPAKCYSTLLLAKHSLVYHSYLIFSTFFIGHNSEITCRFCNTFTSRTNLKNHVQDVHPIDYHDWFITQFKLSNGGDTGLIVTEQISVAPEIKVAEELNIQLQKLNIVCNTSQQPPRRSILAAGKCKRRNKLPVRRELRFSILEKENNRVTTSSVRRNNEDSDWVSAMQDCSFRCGKCYISFSNNTELVSHVKSYHKLLTRNIFHPIYQCALCDAKFFKDTYLQKHSALHQRKRLR